VLCLQAQGRQWTWVLCGKNGAATPTMRSPDTYTTNDLHHGVCVNADAADYVDWTAAEPLGSGCLWSGLIRGLLAAEGGASGVTIRCYASEWGFWIEVEENGTSNAVHTMHARVIDPGKTAAQSTLALADGSILVWGGTGSTQNWHTSNSWCFGQGSTYFQPFVHDVTAGEPHSYYWSAGGAAWSTLGRLLNVNTDADMDQAVDVDGVPIRFDEILVDSSTRRVIGKLHEIQICGGQAGQVLSAGGEHVGYISAAHTATDGWGYLLLAVP
jgi:hypothetical protein